MAEVELSIAGRGYSISCRDGGEAHLRTLGEHVDAKAREAASAVGGMNEARQLLFAALLIADELVEAKAAIPGLETDPALAPALEALAARIEAVADALEPTAANA